MAVKALKAKGLSASEIAIAIQIEGASYRLREDADLIPENLRVRPSAPLQMSSSPTRLIWRTD